MTQDIVVLTGKTTIIFQLAFHYTSTLVSRRMPTFTSNEDMLFLPIGTFECNFMFPDNFSVQMAVSICAIVPTGLG
jgi:hypothetical protein